MSWDFYKSQGYQNVTPKYKEIPVGNVNNVIWTPTSSMRIVVNSIIVTSQMAGTIAFYFGGKNNAYQICTLSTAGSFTIAPEIEGWESTAIDAPFYAVASVSSPTTPWTVTAEGFELE